jgi:hypothetical protein
MPEEPKEPEGQITCPHCGAKCEQVEVIETDIVMKSYYKVVGTKEGALRSPSSTGARNTKKGRTSSLHPVPQLLGRLPTDPRV